jgi:two-component system phosphate regulon sensor histidine kinase PhoR
MGKEPSDFFDRYRNLVVLAAFAMLGFVAWLDFNTGVEISFSIFYLIPVSLVAWSAGIAPALAMSVICAVAWLLMDYKLGGRVYSSPTVAYWNSLVRFGFFSVTAVSAGLIRRMLRRERENSRLKSDMVSMVSHEFNNSLITINLLSSLLQEHEGESFAGERRKLYEMLDNTSSNLAQTIKNFLNKARLEAGKFVLDIQPTELRKIVMGVVDTVRPLCDAKNISLTVNFPEGVIPVKCDPDAIALVVNNLIGNAIKYTPQNGRVTVRVAPKAGVSGQVLISVADTGIGVEKKDLTAIFTGFYRSDSGKHSAKGFGLGLKVAQDLLKAHGSRVLLESDPGKGSKFSFELPVWTDTPVK